MERISKENDIGYLVSKSGTILPIRPLQIRNDINKKGVSYSKGKKLYIHNEILEYYIVEDYIKQADHLLNHNSFELFCGIADLGLTLIIRTMHELNFFLPDHITRKEYEAITKIQTELKEPIRGIARPFVLDDYYEVETFSDLKTAVKTINTRYKEKQEGKKK